MAALADKQGNKTGGRQAGTPNRGTRQVKEFLERVFTRAFTETRLVRVPIVDQPGKFEERHVTLEDSLVEQILEGTIDVNLLRTLLTYHAGRPAPAVDDKSKGGKYSLEQIITGQLPDDDEDAPLLAPGGDPGVAH